MSGDIEDDTKSDNGGELFEGQRLRDRQITKARDSHRTKS
jgi:hypothetical protein